MAKNLISCPLVIFPENTLKYISIPLKGLYTESKIRALSSSFNLFLGAGILSTIALSISFIPSPVFAEAKIISSCLQPNRSTISSETSSGFAEGKSILLRMGIISKSFSSAKYRFEIV